VSIQDEWEEKDAWVSIESIKKYQTMSGIFLFGTFVQISVKPLGVSFSILNTSTVASCFLPL
jgi:hypothetical protein|tara:strand:- start:24624 stop:24809 length:186 start_codon:yes stop_codon:yes gene_type:complete